MSAHFEMLAHSLKLKLNHGQAGSLKVAGGQPYSL